MNTCGAHPAAPRESIISTQLPRRLFWDVTGPAASWSTTLRLPGGEPQGLFLEGDTLWVTSLLDASRGDLLLRRFAQDASGEWAVQDAMELRGFGHGIAFGVERADAGTPLVWLECAAARGGSDPRNAYGTAIATIPYRPGETVSSPPGFAPAGEARHYSCSVQAEANGGRGILVCRWINGVAFYRAFDLASARDGIAVPLGEAVPEPRVISGAEHGPLQGWAAHDSVVYAVSGVGRAAARSSAAYLTTIDLTSALNGPEGYLAHCRRDDGEFAERPREPEGILVDQATRRLVFALVNRRKEEGWAVHTFGIEESRPAPA